jgi:hypothetical protein
VPRDWLATLNCPDDAPHSAIVGCASCPWLRSRFRSSSPRLRSRIQSCGCSRHGPRSFRLLPAVRAIELLWPEAELEAGAANLRTTLHRLRQVLDGPGAMVSYLWSEGELLVLLGAMAGTPGGAVRTARFAAAPILLAVGDPDSARYLGTGHGAVSHMAPRPQRASRVSTLTPTRTRQGTRSCCSAHKTLHLTGGRPDNAASHETRTRVTVASHLLLRWVKWLRYMSVRAAPATSSDEGREWPRDVDNEAAAPS